MSVFTAYQEKEIRLGLEQGLDISWYNKFEYDALKMRAIRIGLQKGLDPRIFAKPEFDSLQINEITQGLSAGVDASVYADAKYYPAQMYQIRKGLEKGLDVSYYLDEKLDNQQMCEIRWGLMNGVDVTQYNKPYLSADYMSMARKKLIGYADSDEIEPVKMWEGNTRKLDKSFDVYVSNKKQILDDRFLDWESTIDSAKLSEVSEKMPEIGTSLELKGKEVSGFTLYNELKVKLVENSKVVNALSDLGYCGISYDSFERSNRNIVVFDEKKKAEMVGSGIARPAQSSEKHKLSYGEMEALFRSFNSYTNGNIEVIYVKENMPLPQKVREQIDECSGVGYGKCLFVNPENVESREEIFNLWVKEVGAKEGLEVLMPDNHIREAFLHWVWAKAVELSNDQDNKEVVRIVGEVRTRYDKSEGSLKDDMLKCPDYAMSRLGEMFLGDFASTVAVQKELNKQEKGFWNNISEKFKNILDKTFGVKTGKTITERDLAKVVACAVKAGESQKTKIRVVLKDKIQFRRKEENRVANEAANKKKFGL